VLDSLLQSHTGSLLIFQYANIERERSCFLLHFREDGARIFHFQLVGDRGIPLEECRTGLFHTCLKDEEVHDYEKIIAQHTFPSSPVDTKISMPYTSPSAKVDSFKLPFLTLAGVQDDAFLPIDNILCLLARKHAYECT
jgi:hypothetical protein